MPIRLLYHLLAGSPLGRALQHYIQHGMAPNFLRRLTLRLCYWYQFTTGRQTTVLDVQAYRRTRTTLEELRHAYILWQRHRSSCRCGCEVIDADFGAFSLAVNHSQELGWLGEGSEDDDETLVDDRRDGPRRRSRDSPDALRRRRERRGAISVANIHPSSNGRSRSSPPDSSTEQRNLPAISSTDFGRLRGRFAHRASNARENSRTISTASLMNRVIGRSDAGWSNLVWRARSSSNISGRTLERSRDSSMSGRGMRGPPNLATDQRTVGNSHPPSRIDARTRSGSLDSSMADRGRMPILPPIDTRRLVERLAMLSEAELSSFWARASDVFSEIRAGPANSHGELVDRWHRVATLMNELPGA